MIGFRIWATVDGRYVGDGHVDAALLVAGPADKRPADFDIEAFQNADGSFGSPGAAANAKPEADAEKAEPAADAEPEKAEPVPTAKRTRK